MQALLRRVEEGGEGCFKFEEGCGVVEEAVEGGVRDEEEVRGGRIEATTTTPPQLRH